MLISKLMKAMRPRPSADPAMDIQYPLELEAKLNALHSRADVRKHLDILHGDLTIGGERYTDLYTRCLEATGTAVTAFSVFQRFQTRYDLVRYCLATMDVPGARAECGAYRGATALLLCNVVRSRRPDFSGEAFYLIDSFSGTSPSTSRDLIPVRDAGGATRQSAFFPAGKTDVTADAVRGYFSGFPQAKICAGWIPQVFSELPSTTWAFVHLDLTLYEPTLAALSYFYPRLASGGVIICDGSVFCPGAQHAVDEFSSANDAPYVWLGYRESVFVKP
jgi:hypothetical protein